MGDMVVSALVQQVVGKLTSKAIKELALLWGLEEDVLTLKDDFEQIKAVLQDAEEKRVKNNAIEHWLQSLRSVSLKVENVLDEISTQALLQRLHKESGIQYMVRAFFSCDHNQLLFRVRIANKVKAMRKELDVIASKRFVLDLTPSRVGLSPIDVGNEGEMPHRETGMLIHASLIFGRNEEIEMVTEKICNKDIGKYEDCEIRVYGIWGMGGVGKTSLAQLVFNHEKVKTNFPLRCWVYVSEKFQVKEIIKKIIEFIDQCGCTLTELSTLQDTLQRKLEGKKYLIVLDDVWIEDNEKAKWEELSKTLSCGAEGSTIVITTRSSTTSRMMAKVGELQHEVGCLSDEDSWLLFNKFAFAEGREGDAISELEPIGREIVKKCKGLPLALKTLGSLMWSKSSASDWQRVKDSGIWVLQEANILPALKLSYDNLLPHLKRCFAYCCLFPKGFRMKKDELIPLWESIGFIPPRGETDLYVIGEEIFNCLVWRSFFQVDKNDINDTYIMHDLMHDMAQHVMRHDCLVIEYACNKVRIPNEVLHLSLLYPEEKFIFSTEDLGKLRSLRSMFVSLEFTVLFQSGKLKKPNFIKVFNQSAFLRVLYLPRVNLRTLPESVCKLKHLKYLNLSLSSIEVLPNSIMYLQNLEVLILSSCINLYKLPESICKNKHLKYLNLSNSGIRFLPKGLKYMTNLRRLDNNLCYFLQHLPIGFKELTSLQRLPMFPVGKEIGAKIEELGDLNLLEGELLISELNNVGSLSEAKSANLKCKTNLSVLTLSWSDTPRVPGIFEYDEDILEGLEPNPRLKSLNIYIYMGKNISPSWMTSLSNLVEICIFYSTKCEYILALGRLPNLKVIKLKKNDSLKRFHDDDTNMLEDTTNIFVSLQELYVFRCPKLVSLPSNLPKLKVLRLFYCDELGSLPDQIQSFKHLNRLDIYCCKHLSERYEKEKGVAWSTISHIPNIYIDDPSSWDDDDKITKEWLASYDT